MVKSKEEQPKPQKTDAELCEFGKVMCVVLLVISGVLLWKERPATPYLLFLSLVFYVFGVFAPRLLAPVEKVWMKFAEILGKIVTPIVVVLTFYFVITPMGVLIRIMGKDLLSLKFDSDKESYWVPVEVGGPGTRFDKPY